MASWPEPRETLYDGGCSFLIKFARVLCDNGRRESWCRLNGEFLEVLVGDLFGKWGVSEEKLGSDEVRFLPPCVPTKIVCVGLNYRDHAEELNMPVPGEPVIFLKPPSSLLGPEGVIRRPPGCSRLDYEAELAVIMKKTARSVPVSEARKYIMGYTCFNDVTARNFQEPGGQWTRAKSYDTFAPLGPVMVSGAEPDGLGIELRLNGRVKQSSGTSEMVFGVDELVSIISGYMTLNPGDVIATGTPPGVGSMAAGDTVEVVIENIGSLRNYVAE